MKMTNRLMDTSPGRLNLNRTVVRTVVLGLGVTMMLASVAAPASKNDTERGLEIAQKMDQADSGYGSYSAAVEMRLRDRKGRESVRQMRFQTKEVEDDGDKSLVVFESPHDIRGVAALTYAHPVESDDQWLYLPDLRRVKRISSANQAGPFVGSEFAYEDIGSQELPKYRYRYLRDEAHQGRACHLIERDPVNPNSGYSKQVVWVDAERAIPWRIDYYDRKDSLLKTLTYVGYQKYAEHFWRPDSVEMVNHPLGKSTLITYSDYRFDQQLTDQDLSPAALSRLR